MAISDCRFLPALVLSATWVLLSLGCVDINQPNGGSEGAVEAKHSALTGYRFGVTNQEDFQNDWAESLWFSDENAGGFGPAADATNEYAWWFNLVGGKPWLENTLDQNEGGADSVHFLYSVTHGAKPPYAGFSTWEGLAMWENQQWAQSPNMRLGDEGNQLGVWAAYSCDLLNLSDGNAWNRWASAFRGGLYMLLGSHGSLWDSPNTDETGENMGYALNNSNPLWGEWKYSVSDWWFDQDVAVMATGRYWEDCLWRLDNFRWPSVMTHGRLRDGDIVSWCVRYVTDI